MDDDDSSAGKSHERCTKSALAAASKALVRHSTVVHLAQESTLLQKNRSNACDD